MKLVYHGYHPSISSSQRWPWQENHRTIAGGFSSKPWSWLIEGTLDGSGRIACWLSCSWAPLPILPQEISAESMWSLLRRIWVCPKKWHPLIPLVNHHVLYFYFLGVPISPPHMTNFPTNPKFHIIQINISWFPSKHHEISPWYLHCIPILSPLYPPLCFQYTPHSTISLTSPG